jgi:hypothetical protein
MVHAMDAEDKLKAVHYWNIISERLQEIVNHSVDDISALTFQMEGEKVYHLMIDCASKYRIVICLATSN